MISDKRLAISDKRSAIRDTRRYAMNRQSRFQNILTKIYPIRRCEMKGKWILLGSITVVAVLALAVGLTQRPGPEPPEGVGA